MFDPSRIHFFGIRSTTTPAMGLKRMPGIVNARMVIPSCVADPVSFSTSTIWMKWMACCEVCAINCANQSARKCAVGQHRAEAAIR